MVYNIPNQASPNMSIEKKHTEPSCRAAYSAFFPNHWAENYLLEKIFWQITYISSSYTMGIFVTLSYPPF